jgi:ribosome production factor 2
MTVVQRIVKPKTRRGKKFLENRESKLIENAKTALFVRGLNCSEVSLGFMKDLLQFKKPRGVFYGRKNDIKPFEDASSLEFYGRKSDASLFMFGSHNKKRPHNIVLGRMFDFQVLDMIEVGIEKFKSLKDFKVPKIPTETKPCLQFAGEMFDTDPDYQRLKNLLIDFFRGPEVTTIRLAGLEHVIMFTAVDGKVYMRSYRILLKKSGSRTPRVEVEEIGPAADFVLRRTKLASEDLFKQSMKQPKEIKPRKIKNVSKDPFGSKLGRIHMGRNDMSKLQTRKMKGLKKSAVERQQERRAKVNATTDQGEDASQTSKRKHTGDNKHSKKHLKTDSN